MVRGGMVACVLLAAGGAIAGAAPQAELWPRWEAHDPASTATIDHEPWGSFLDRYLDADHASGVNRVRYASVSASDHAALERYIAALEAVPISQYNRDEQIAYWINLYNAATVDVILDEWPVASIRDIGGTRLSPGPWNDPVVRVEGEALTLNDVEHRIIRPIWQDPRIHYVVNCASIGCPNLYPEPLTATTWEAIFEESARDYLTHPRGLSFSGSTLNLSSIFDWYVADFGGNLAGVLAHAAPYVDAPTAARLRDHTGRTRYDYDWSINAP